MTPGPGDAPPDRRLTRRAIGVLAGAGLIGGGVVAARWFNIAADDSAADALSAPQAHAAVQAGDILLVDIRRPDEWTRTGLPAGGVPLDMRRGDFTEALTRAAGGDADRPVALICARGVRSRRLAGKLRAAGFTAVLDVSEGMLGSGAGPGWLARGLPVVPWQEG